MSVVIVLGILAVVVSLWDKFGTPRYRPYRALVFIVFGLSGIAPATHYAVLNGILDCILKFVKRHLPKAEVSLESL